MTLWLIIGIVVFLGLTALVAKLPFGLARPAKWLTLAGILGAVSILIGTILQPSETELSPVSVIGTFVSLIALLGLLLLVLIWAIRRWGIKHDDNPWSDP